MKSYADLFHFFFATSMVRGDLCSLLFKLLLVSALVLFPLFDAAFSQQSAIKFEHLTVEQGLSQNTVVSIYQDRAGFMWFGTLDGLNKYDGLSFTHYRNPFDAQSAYHNYITVIYEDTYGLFWIGADAKLYRFDRRTERFTRFEPNMISAINEDNDGNLWVGTVESGLYKFDRQTGSFVHYPHEPADPKSLSDSTVVSVYKDQTGTLWVGTYNGGLNELVVRPDSMRGEQAEGSGRVEFIHYRSDPTDPKSLSHNMIYAICASPHGAAGTLWIATDAGLSRLDLQHKSKKEFLHYKHDPADPNSFPPHAVVSLLYEKETSTLWLANKEGGLSQLDIATGKFTHFRHDPADPASLSHDNVATLYQDRSGMIWAGTRGGGVNKFDRKNLRFKHVQSDPDDPKSLGDNSVWSFYEDRSGTLWVGTGLGLSRVDYRAGHNVAFVNYRSQPGYPVRAICEDNSGVLWLATLGGGLGKFDKEKSEFAYFKAKSTNPYSLQNNNSYTLYEDHSGILWLGSNVGGLSRFDKNSEQFTHVTDKLGLTDLWVMTIHEDETGALWLGTWEKGLMRYDRTTQEILSYKHDPAAPNSLSNNTVMAIHEDPNGNLWIGTNGGGVCKLQAADHTNGIKGQRIKFTRFTEKNGLPSNVIYGIVEDHNGYLWLSTNKGLSRFDPQTGMFKNFDMEDGLQSNEFNLGAYYKSQSGEMFFGGINGFNRFYPNDLVNAIPPMIALTAFKKFGKKVDLGKPISGVKKIELSYKDDFFAFEFVALHYKNPRRNQYAYRMAGFDKDWIDIGARREASYTNLDTGRYTFRVKAANSDGVWNEEGLAIDIIITPPFWRRWWFSLLVAGFVITVAVNLYRYKIRQVLKIERARVEERERIQNKIAADFHDDLGHRVTKMTLFANILKQNWQTASPQARTYLDKLTQNADGLYKEMKEFIWELDPRKDSVYDLAVQLKHFSDQLFDETDIAFQLISPAEELHKIALTLEWRQHILRIFKEAMHNILKHAAGCKNVILKIALEKGCLEITLADDGQGFDSHNYSTGNGFQNMQERARKLAAHLHIASETGRGATVHFTGKLP